MATKKQLAARALFAKRARSGAFRKNNPDSRATVYKCKCHSKPYTVCKTCRHQYCQTYWPRGCPTCAERRLKNPFAKGVKKAVTRGRKVVRAVSGGLKKAQAIYRALHPGKALPASLASRKKRKQNPLHFVVFTKRAYGENWIQRGTFATKAKAMSCAAKWRQKHPGYGIKVISE